MIGIFACTSQVRTRRQTCSCTAVPSLQAATRIAHTSETGFLQDPILKTFSLTLGFYNTITVPSTITDTTCLPRLKEAWACISTAHVGAREVRETELLRANLVLALDLPKQTKTLASILCIQIQLTLCGIKDSRVIYLQVPAWCLQRLN